MRKLVVAGNWKMNGTRSSVISLIEGMKQQKTRSIEVIVFPSFIHIPQAELLLVGTSLKWGAQNIYLGDSGAFTGEVSAYMVKDYGCQFVLVGHSERRTLFKEDLKLIANKFKAVLDHGLTPVLCIGETLAEREKQLTESVLTEQLDSVINLAGIQAFNHAIIAYEPVWAIGTGQTATPSQAQETHLFIRQLIEKRDPTIANKIRILYGGSVKADNAFSLFSMPDIDGGLIGGASLDSVSFLSICGEAEKLCTN